MIIRRRRNRNYTVINNDPFDDPRLSTAALGVLCYLRSRPDNWNVIPAQLAKRFNCGRDHMQRCLKELAEANYIKFNRIRDQSGAFVGGEYLVYDEPEESTDKKDVSRKPENPVVAECQPEKPEQDKPREEKPQQENPAELLNKDSLPSKDSKQVRIDDVERAKPKIKPRELEDKLREAAGEDVLNSASPNIMVMAEPLRWMQQGADLELDILPTVRAVGERVRQRPMHFGRKIAGWAFFTQDVMGAYRQRMEEIPTSTTPYHGETNGNRNRGDGIAGAVDRLKQRAKSGAVVPPPREF